MPSAPESPDAPVFFAPPPWPRCGESLALSAAETHHLRRVLRLRPGARAQLVDGEGRGARAEVLPGGARASVRLLEVGSATSAPRRAIELAVPWIKSPARIDWLIEKAVELGAGSVSLFTAERSVRRPARLSAARAERWQAIARAAMKQCGRAWLPAISHAASLDALLAARTARVLVADPRGGARIDARAWGRESDMLLLVVGPEGGFSPREDERLRAQGATAVALGPARLRVETAALSLLVRVCAALEAKAAAETTEV